MTVDDGPGRAAIETLYRAQEAAGPAGAEVAPRLAVLLAERFVRPDGKAADREAAIAQASQYLRGPAASEPGLAICRLVIAWMTLCGQLTDVHRQAAVAGPAGMTPAAGGIAQLSETAVSVADAGSAAAQLAQIEDLAVADGVAPGFAAQLWAIAVLVMLRGGRPADPAPVIAEADRALRLLSAGCPARADLLALRAALLAMQTQLPGGPVATPEMAEAIMAAALALPPGHLMRPPLLGELGPILRRLVGAAADGVSAGAETLLAVLEQLPDDTPNLGQTLADGTVKLLNLTLHHRSVISRDRLLVLLEKATGMLGPSDPMRLVAEYMGAGAVGLHGSIEHQPGALDEAEERLRAMMSAAMDFPAVRAMAVMGLAAVAMERYAMNGDLRQLQNAERELGDFMGSEQGTGLALAQEAAGLGRYFSAILKLARYQHSFSNAVLHEAIADLEFAAGALPPGNPLLARIMADLGGLRALDMMQPYRLEASVPELSPAIRTALGSALAAAEMAGPDHADYTILMAQAAVAKALEAAADRRDIGRLDEAIALLGTACARPALSLRERSRLLHMHGSMLLFRYDASRRDRDLAFAIDRLESARRAVEQEDASPYASAVLESLAEAYRIRGDEERGDVDRAVTIGLAALREHAGDVLLQDSDENALHAGRVGTVDALTMARWFLERGRPGPAISAIELGRGMVLYAATAGARLGDVLRQAGHTELAGEWEREWSERRGQPDGQPADPSTRSSGDLRYRIMLAIEGSGAEARLLAPPDLGEIRRAVAEAGADALVFLLPSEREDSGPKPGLAIMVWPAEPADSGGEAEPATAGVRWLSLPRLAAGPESLARLCAQARAEADRLGPKDGSYESEAQREAHQLAQQHWRDQLAQLCDWAWQVAMGPLLRELPAAPGRERRLVLVPVGELGLVPWHAARSRTPAGFRYACQEAIFSYAASARQFTETVAVTPPPWTDNAVLVSEASASQNSLHATMRAIQYIQRSCYPGARVFGDAYRMVAADGAPGSARVRPGDVLAALPGASSAMASMLHFSCHARATVPVLASHLDLGTGGDLAVSRILEQARERSRTDQGGLVVLASCLSDVAEADYDEALTLATAFLSAGACGVVGARWSVTEFEAALFMVAFHRFLSHDPPDPARALRCAQLWMLDPDRAELPGLPAVLRDEVRQPELADPAAWAGFAYRGH